MFTQLLSNIGNMFTHNIAAVYRVIIHNDGMTVGSCTLILLTYSIDHLDYTVVIHEISVLTRFNRG